MTLNEFKAWFEGFIEKINGLPTEEQWKRICLTIKRIDGTITTEPMFIHRYWSHRGSWWDYPRWHGLPRASMTDEYNSEDAFRALGRAEFDTTVSRSPDNSRRDERPLYLALW
jgi:hypothetical protein